MDTRLYPVDVEIQLTPVGSPYCKITVGDQTKDIQILKPCWIKFEILGRDNTKITVEHHSKADNDPSTAVIVEQIKFDGIYDPKFVWEGVYCPNYPKHLTGDKLLKSHNYLGWNGVWTLDFSLPIYTWIHKILNLGWIYD